MNGYDIGDVVRLTGTFTNLAGAAADPTTVTLKVARRGQTVTTATYAAAQITRTGAGIYYYDLTVVGDGIHDYRFEATGTVTAAVEGSFVVAATQFP